MSDSSNVILIPALALPAGCCCWAAVMAFRWRGRRARRGEPLIWTGFGLFFLSCIVMILGGTVAAVENAARGALRQEGLYADRRPMQIAALCVVGLVLAIVLCLLPQVVARWRRYRWTIIGSLAVAGFATIRAISLHEVDELGNSMAWIKVLVESGGPLLAAWGAFARGWELCRREAEDGTHA